MEDKVDIGVSALTPAEAVFVEEAPPAQPAEALEEKAEPTGSASESAISEE